MHARYVISFIGDDRTGIVEQLADMIAAAGGNWLDSQLTRLEGKFTGVILIALDDEGAASLMAKLDGLTGTDLDIRMTPAGTSPSSALQTIQMTVTGADRTGIVREVSRALARADISVSRLESGVESAPFTGEPMFKAVIVATAPENEDLSDIQAALDDIADDMMLEIDLEH